MPAPHHHIISFEAQGLNRTLEALATGAAQIIIEDAFAEMYPVCYDPETGVCIISEDN